MVQATSEDEADTVRSPDVEPYSGTHGDLLKRRALEHPESPLSRELMMAGNWVNHLNGQIIADSVHIAELLQALGPISSITLGDDIAGKITEKEAVELVNQVLCAKRSVAKAFLNDRLRQIAKGPKS